MVREPASNTTHSATFSMVSAALPFNGNVLEIAVKATKYYPIRWLLDEAHQGDKIMIRANAIGRDFSPLLNASSTPLLLIAAGIGITPVLSFVQYLASSYDLTPQARTIQIVHQANSPTEFVLWRRLVDFADKHPNVNLSYLVSDSHHRAHLELLDAALKRYANFGELNDDRIRSLIVTPDTHVIMCGPAGFMSSVSNGISWLHGLPQTHIHRL